ncbi:MAG: hypothetical protein A2Y10_05735 [Planctomycetes bacterium GWF2_41_51]|nr:MAG: hypothetical protein A2Y10_05735 [Planctomycetes bacterium GWF2_41_51]
MTLDLFIILGASFIALIVGGLTGIFGIGGGFLTTPALMIFLDIPGPIAVGTGIAMMCFTSSFAIYKRRGSDTINFKLAFILAIASSIGVIVGMYFLEKLKHVQPLVIMGKEHIAVQYILLLVFVFLLLGIAIIMMIDFLAGKDKTNPHIGWFSKIPFPPYIQLKFLHVPTLPLIPVLLLGTIIGILTGFLGIGGGVILLPALIYMIGQQVPKAAGTSLMIVWFSTLVGVTGHLRSGNVSIFLLIAMLAGGLIGTHYGTVIGLKMHDHKLRFYFSFVVAATVLIVLFKIINITFYN